MRDSSEDDVNSAKSSETMKRHCSQRRREEADQADLEKAIRIRFAGSGQSELGADEMTILTRTVRFSFSPLKATTMLED